MTWTLHSDGVNDSVSVGGNINTSEDFTLEIKFGNGNDTNLAWIAAETENRIFGVNNNNNTMYGKVTATTNRFRIRAFNTNSDFDWDDITHSFIDAHEYKIIQDGTDSFLYVDNVLKATLLSDTREIRIGSIMGNIGGEFTSFDLWYLNLADVTTPGNDRQFNADSSGGTGNVLPNDIGTDATLVNFPTDDSQWVDVSSGITITVDSGSYTVTGTDVILVDPPAAETIVINSGAYSISGTSINLVTDYVEVVTSGSYTYTGTNVNLVADYKEVISSGSYAYTGTDVILIDPPVSGSITIQSGLYTLAGTDINLLTSFKTQINTGSYSLTGTAINFAITRGMTIDQGSYIIQGTNINFSNTGASIWTDKPSVVTLWGDKSPVTTNWTDK